MFHNRKLRRRNPFVANQFRRNLIDPAQLAALRRNPMGAHESNKKHHESELLVSQAEILMRKGQRKEARLAYQNASVLEEQATDSLPLNLPRTFSIYATSAVALAYRSQDITRTKTLIAKYKPRVQDWAVDQMDSILEEIHAGNRQNPYRRNLIDASQLVALRKNPYRRNLWVGQTSSSSRAARLEEMKDALSFADPSRVDVVAWANIYDLVPRDVINAAEELGIEVGARGIKDPCWPDACPPYSGNRKNPSSQYIVQLDKPFEEVKLYQISRVTMAIYYRFGKEVARFIPSAEQLKKINAGHGTFGITGKQLHSAANLEARGFRKNPDPEGNPWGPSLYNPLKDSKHEFKDESHYQRMIAKLRRRNPFKGL